MNHKDKLYFTEFTLAKPTERDLDLFPVLSKLVEAIRGEIQVDEGLILRHYISAHDNDDGTRQINTHFAIDGVEGELVFGENFQNEIEFIEAVKPKLIQLIKSVQRV